MLNFDIATSCPFEEHVAKQYVEEVVFKYFTFFIAQGVAVCPKFRPMVYIIDPSYLRTETVAKLNVGDDFNEPMK